MYMRAFTIPTLECMHNHPTEINPYTDSLPTNSKPLSRPSRGRLWKCKFLPYILSLLACIANSGLIDFPKTRWSDRSIIMYGPSLRPSAHLYLVSCLLVTIMLSSSLLSCSGMLHVASTTPSTEATPPATQACLSLLILWPS